MARYYVTLTIDRMDGFIVSTHRLYRRAREVAARVARSRGSWRGIAVTDAEYHPITLRSMTHAGPAPTH